MIDDPLVRVPREELRRVCAVADAAVAYVSTVAAASHEYAEDEYIALRDAVAAYREAR